MLQSAPTNPEEQLHVPVVVSQMPFPWQFRGQLNVEFVTGVEIGVGVGVGVKMISQVPLVQV